MSRHTHREIVPGCFRCDIGKDETDATIDRLVRVSEELGLYDLAANLTDRLDAVECRATPHRAPTAHSPTDKEQTDEAL